MTRFLIEVRETHSALYAVNANTADEAKEKLLSGDYEEYVSGEFTSIDSVGKAIEVIDAPTKS